MKIIFFLDRVSGMKENSFSAHCEGAKKEISLMMFFHEGMPGDGIARQVRFHADGSVSVEDGPLAVGMTANATSFVAPEGGGKVIVPPPEAMKDWWGYEAPHPIVKKF